MVRQIIDNEEGYTVVEILVALTLLTIITTVVGSVFIFTARQMTNWRGSVNTVNEIHISTERVFNDMLESNSITISDSLVTLNHPYRKQVVFSGIANTLHRNGVNMSEQADSIYFSEVLFTDSKGKTEIKYVKENRVEIVSIVVSNRQPQLWESLKGN